MNNIEEIIKEKINNSKNEWSSSPFPHLIIDNFLPVELFEKISKSSNQVEEVKNFKKFFTSQVELNKKVYGNNDLKGDLRLPVEIIGGKTIKEVIENFLNINGLISLNDWENYGGYYPFHTMKTGGLLGAHVDHSHSLSDNKLLHVANAIFYVSEKWNEDYVQDVIKNRKRYDIGQSHKDIMGPNGWSYISLLSEEERNKILDPFREDENYIGYNEEADKQAREIVSKIISQL